MEQIYALIELAKEICNTHPLVGRMIKVTDSKNIITTTDNTKGCLTNCEVMILTPPFVKNGEMYVRTYSFNSGLEYTIPFKEENLVYER